MMSWLKNEPFCLFFLFFLYFFIIMICHNNKYQIKLSNAIISLINDVLGNIKIPKDVTFEFGKKYYSLSNCLMYNIIST